MTGIILLVIAILIFNIFINRIPRTGRAGITKGNVVDCIITNSHKNALRTVSIHAFGGGRKFKARLKSDEAHLWIKGDKIKVLVSDENEKIYRILYFDYFHQNEARLREEAISRMEKDIKENGISARIVKYTKQTLLQIKKSSIDSQKIFILLSYMRLLNSYVVTTVIFSLVALVCRKIYSIPMKEMLLPIVAVGILLWYIYSAKTVCERIIKEAQKDCV